MMLWIKEMSVCLWDQVREAATLPTSIQGWMVSFMWSLHVWICYLWPCCLFSTNRKDWETSSPETQKCQLESVESCLDLKWLFFLCGCQRPKFYFPEKVGDILRGALSLSGKCWSGLLWGTTNDSPFKWLSSAQSYSFFALEGLGKGVDQPFRKRCAFSLLEPLFSQEEPVFPRGTTEERAMQGRGPPSAPASGALHPPP